MKVKLHLDLLRQPKMLVAKLLKKPVTAPLSTEQIDQAMAEMTGEITQIPPMFSAVKVNGKRLYEYARNGEEVERPQRKL